MRWLVLAACLFVAQTALAAQPVEKLYAEHCASCHGADRPGGIGPALLPENLARLRRPEPSINCRCLIITFMMEFTVSQIATMLGGDVQGNGSEKINMLAKIQDAKKGHIAFLSNPKYESFIYTIHASAVIVKKDFVPRKELTSALILVDDPYSSFTVLLEEYHKLISFQKTGIEQPCYIGENSTIGQNIYRGAFSYIGSNVKVGDNVKIYPHVFIGDNCTIGNNTILHPKVKVYADAKIGSNCVLHSGVVIGSDGSVT